MACAHAHLLVLPFSKSERHIMQLIFITQVRALSSLQGAIYHEQQKKSKVVWKKTEFL